MAKRDEDMALSELQADVMRVLWQRGEASTADVADALAASRALAHTTVATLLSRLEKRGAVRSRRDGRQLVYTARVSEEAVRRSMVAGLVDSIFGGDPGALVAHLVSESEVAPGDLDTIRRMLAKGAK
ncbi:MAG TPA: BlaI/MecI/CopY family transcriptional regulator [Xanthomonadales bacterium]|nr:BlaI/MecI/CopY family transcriptional regulator [Xanthomonadales bacterium]